MKLKLTGGIFFLIALILMYCGRKPSEIAGKNEGIYLNLNDTVDYVGMQTCRSCHPNVYETYIETGMGRSFDRATKEKSDAVFNQHAVVYDKVLDFYYKPYWQDSILYIKEFRLEGSDTVHSRIEKISYVIGSGQHTNSHLIDQNGYLYQAPITFYTQDGKWDMAPGFESGASSRFSRIIASECMTCHNHLPQQVAGSENKYSYVPRGIECERCHGPGEIHVNEKLKGNLVDTSKFIDYTIVNPANLSPDLRVDLCQRCHLQGTAVLNDGKTFFDFRPGMKLNEVMNVFLPRYTNAHDKFIMASQADRMRLSKCFTIGKMGCTTCHNPHKSVEATTRQVFNQACLDCHQKTDKAICSAPEPERLKKDNDCVACHMPKTGSIDIPHVRITDHNIGIPIDSIEKDGIARFIGLECLTTDHPSDLEMARGYLALFDKFIPEQGMLDSASAFLNRSNATEKEKFKTLVHFYFNTSDYQNLMKVAQKLGIKAADDGWTAYRIGEAFLKSGDPTNALVYFEQAVDYKPYNLDFNNKLGVTYLSIQNNTKAKSIFEFILNENPKQPIALSNLGYINLLEKNLEEAERLYSEAISLDPDYEQAQLNMIGLYIFKNDITQAKSSVSEFLKKYPDNQQAMMIFNQINGL